MSNRHELATSKAGVFAAWAALCAALLFAACREASPPSTAGLPAEYLGRWYFDGKSGGIEGREVASADGSWIVITPDNAIEHHSPEGDLEASETFEPVRGPSIFSENDQWILARPDAIERVLQLHPEGVLTISENVYDGFSSRYTRTR